MMGEPVTQVLFFERMDQLQRQFQDSHARLRQSMEAGFDKVSEKLEEHAKDDQAVADRVLVIETERTGEKAAAMRQGAKMALFGAAGLTALWEGIKHVAGWH